MAPWFGRGNLTLMLNSHSHLKLKTDLANVWGYDCMCYMYIIYEELVALSVVMSLCINLYLESSYDV